MIVLDYLKETARGSISAFEFLDRYHVKEKYDTVVYDVLGDVVCGGFAVPVRREEAHVTLMEFELLVIVNSPGASLIGDHLRKLADTVLKDRPCVILESPGYSQDFDTGYEEAVLELLKQLPGLCFCGGVLGLIHRVVFFTCLIIFSISFEAFTGVILTV